MDSKMISENPTPPAVATVSNVEIPATIAAQIERCRLFDSFAAQNLARALELKIACHGNPASTGNQRDAFTHVVKSHEKAIDRNVSAGYAEIAMLIGMVPRKVK